MQDRSAWSRVSADPLGNRMASAQLRDAFTVYFSHELLIGLDGEVNRLLYGPLFDDPDEAVTSYRIAKRILAQQVSWATDAVTKHRAFLEKYP